MTWWQCRGGSITTKAGDSASAREKFESAIQRAIKIAYLSAEAPWSLQLAAIEMRQGEPDAARATLEAAMRVAEGLRPTFRIAEVCAALAALEQSQGNARAAEQWRLRRDEEQFLFRSEQSRSRAVLRTIPKGDYSFTDYLEDDLVSDVPVKMTVTVRSTGDGTVVLDYTGSVPQVQAALNLPTGSQRHHPFQSLAIMKVVRVPVVTPGRDRS